jgi:outer membrane protein OmpA-like peptidoglycan-associated protein
VELTAVRRRLDDETARLQAAISAVKPQLTPRERLINYARAHAVFFNENSTFRDDAQATLVLDEVANLMKDDSLFLRVVGYTDDAGTAAKNLTVSRARAEAVTAALLARGVPANRIVALNRIAIETNVSPVNGVGSANRRVEFEVGFIGEGGR